jgi:hypothetical protein
LLASYAQIDFLFVTYNIHMQAIGTLFNIDIIPEKKSKISNERQWVIKQFVDELNKTAGTKYKVGETWKVVKEVKPAFVAFKLSHLRMVDLYNFLSTCKQSKSSFSKCFYGALKAERSYPQFTQK